ncbi:hypothetical protein [Streptomyces sp. NTH33]|uniref:hypothetical protein n=1 Tax=Streptomyces sp. NTH33 TaxID=1735453 RepID=UPI0011B94A7C|nr:hypothetical protein [Streptomyces sp. NTH33]
MVPSAKVFFEEVRAAYAEAASSLGLTGPAEAEQVMPVSAYRCGGVEYQIGLGFRDGVVECSASTETESVAFTASIEDLALAAGVVDLRGRVSYSARNLKQLRKSLLGQAEYVRLVHPFLAGPAAEGLMRQAGARQWSKGAER